MAMVTENERLEAKQRHAQLIDIFQELPEKVEPKHAMKFFDLETNEGSSGRSSWESQLGTGCAYSVAQ